MAICENTFQTLFVFSLSLFLSYYFPTLVPLDQHMKLSLSREMKDEKFLKENSMNTMAATQDGMMAVGSRLGEINVFSADGKLQNIVLTGVGIRELGYLSDGRIVILDLMNTVTLYTKKYKKLDVRFETLSLEEGGIGSLSVDSNDEIHVSYRKARKIQIFLPAGGKAAKEIQCNGYEPMPFTNYNDLLIIQKYGNTIIIIDKTGNLIHEVLYPNDQSLCFTVSKHNSILVASVAHEEGLLTIDEYTTELKHMQTLISDFKIEKPERNWYYLQQFRSGEIAFCTPDRLYIFNLSKVSTSMTSGLLHRQVVLFVSQGIKYKDLPKKDSMNTMAATPDGRIGVGSWFGGIDIFSADGKLQQISLKDVRILELGFLRDGRMVVRDAMNTMTLYAPDYKQIDVRFETLTVEEGGIGGLTVDSNDQVYVSYRKAKKIQVFSPEGGKAIREIPCHGYVPSQITSYNDVLIVKSYSNEIIIIDKMGNIMHKLTEPTDYNIYADVYNSSSVLIASVRYEEGLLSIDKYTTELQHMTTLISDFKIEIPERDWFYLRQFQSGEIAFCTPDRLYIFSLSEASTTGLFNRRAVNSIGQGIKYVELPKKDDITAMTATPDGSMAVGTYCGGIDIFSANGHLLKTVLKDAIILEVAFLSHGQYVILDNMNTLSLYTPNYKKLDVTFETLSFKEGGCCSISIDSTDQIYVAYRKAKKIQVFSPAGGKAIREIPCDGYVPWKITCYRDLLIVHQYSNVIITIDKEGNIRHKAAGYYLYGAVSNDNTILLARMNHEEGLLSIDEWTGELTFIKTLVSDYEIEKLETDTYYFQKFRTGEITFSTGYRLYIFNLSIIPPPTGLLHRHALKSVSKGIKYVDFHNQHSVLAMAATPDDRMAVGYYEGGIDIFSADGQLQDTLLRYVMILGLGFLSDGSCVVLDITNTIILYTPDYKQLDVRFETISHDEGSYGSLAVSSDDKIYVGYVKAPKIQVFLPSGGKAILEIPCDGYEPIQITCYGDILIVKQNEGSMITMDKKGYIKDKLPSDSLYGAVSKENTILLAHVDHEEGLLSVDEYTKELTPIKTLISDYMIDNLETRWNYIYLQQFQSGEIAFFTRDRLYIFDLSEASTADLLHSQVVMSLSQGIKYVDLPKKDNMNIMAVTPDGRMAVGSNFGGIHIFYADGQLQHTLLRYVKVSGLGFLSSGRCVVLDDMNTITLYTKEYQKMDVKFETLSDEEGGIGELTVDSDNQVYVGYGKAKKIQVFSPEGGKAIREIPCDGYEPMQITSYNEFLIVKQYNNTVIIIDKKGNINHELTKPSGHYLHACVSNNHSVLIASVRHEEGLLSIDEYTTELKHMTILIADFKIENPGRGMYYLQQFQSGEIAFCTPDRLYIFDQSKITVMPVD